MPNIDITKLTIKQAHLHLLAGDFSVKELVDVYRKNIDEKNIELNVFLEVYSDIDEQVERAQKMFDEGHADILTGIPLALKDNILVEGHTASAGSKMLENYTATYSATAVRKLVEKGVVLLGRGNMDEFAMGGSTENSAFGVTKNPHDTERVAGGSSGGSAASVASGMALASFGSDTGGSIRQPAAFCGVCGLKPTYGAVSRHGLMAMGSSFDQIGPLANSVEDLEILFEAIRGIDPMDSTTISSDTYPEHKIEDSLKIGVPFDVLEGIDSDVRKNFEEVVEKMKAKGASVVDIKLPSLDDILATYYVLIPAEISSNLARFDGVRYGFHADGENLIADYFKTRGQGFGEEVKRRIMIGTYVLSAGYNDAYYNNAQVVRTHVREEFAKLFKEVDVIMTPTTPNPAWKIGAKTEDPLSAYLEDIFTVVANVVGVPALSVPTGKTKDGLPIGTQYMATHGAEKTLFTVGKLLETLE